MEVGVPKPLDHWKWNDPTFANWCEVVNQRLQNVYMITIADAGIEKSDLATRWQAKESPYDYVEWLALKFDLDPISSFGGQAQHRR